jgi:adenine-specific DNA-methyltransferase
VKRERKLTKKASSRNIEKLEQRMKMDTIDLKQFPTTRYQGSKRKILPWIFENLRDLEFDTVLDACGGSGSVSYLFKKMNKTVTYNDNLKFNHLIGKAIIENNNILFTNEDLRNLYNTCQNSQDVIQRLFQGVYYLDNENKWLDNISQGIFNMNHYTGYTLSLKKSLAFYALFQASLTKRPFNLFHRKNLDVRTKDVVRNFGNKATWEKDFSTTFESFITEANSLVFDSGRSCQAINESIFDMTNVDYDLVYIDPPYINKHVTNETANYLKCYHFLEGIANYHNWEQMIDFNSRNYRFKDSLLSSHFHKANIYQSFDILFEKFKQSIIVVSYKNGGIPSVETLVKKLKRHKKSVYMRSQHYIYALNKQNGNSERNREVLIIGI